MMDEAGAPEVAGGATTRSDVIVALGEFRSNFARDLSLLTGRPDSFTDRAAAQEGLQLIWSFVAASSPITDTGEALLRDAFPYEMFGANPDEKFEELRESVDDAYADSWKYSASDHLATLAVACATTGDTDAVWRYRHSALALAALTCDVDQPVAGKSVADVGRFNGMLRRVAALCEVAVSESTIPDADQVREFSGRSSAHGTVALDYLGLLDPGLAHRFLEVFAAQFGSDTTRGLLTEAMDQDVSEATLDRLKALHSSLQ